MVTAKVLPMTPEVAEALDRQRRHSMPVCSVLTPELAGCLEAVNGMSRRLRAAGVRVEATVVLDRTIFIRAEDSDALAQAFRSEWRGVSWSTKGLATINSVRLGGCRISWLTPVKEQDQ